MLFTICFLNLCFYDIELNCVVMISFNQVFLKKKKGLWTNFKSFHKLHKACSAKGKAEN